jgi:cytochrome bd ubiquinol oxidase subunit II
LLAGLTGQKAAAPHDTLVALVVAVLAGGAIVFPSLALLFRLALTGRFDAGPGPGHTAGHVLSASMPRLRARVAVGCLIAGVGLLNVAEAQWAHAVGVLSLFGFTVFGVLTLVGETIGQEGALTRPKHDEPRGSP